jgi:hypothetical protein
MFLSVTKTSVDCDFGMSLSLVGTHLPAALDAVAVSGFSVERDRGSAKPTLPLRLHLLNQLLLI